MNVTINLTHTIGCDPLPQLPKDEEENPNSPFG